MRKFLLFILLSVVIIVHAQEERLILDEAKQVNLLPDAPVQLLYITDEAQTVTILAKAIESENTPDAVLWLVDSDNHLLAYNDNFADDTKPQIENLYIEAAGEYTIYVDSFNGVSEGEVEVLIEQGSRFNEQIESDENRLQIKATLPEDSIYRYEIELKATETITITAQDVSSNLDPYLRILDSENTVLAVNDDHNSPDISLDIFDARIADRVVTEDAVYILELRDFLGRAGDFELIIEFETE
jgi:hypothetical protein